jgi:hypothetical protein
MANSTSYEAPHYTVFSNILYKLYTYKNECHSVQLKFCGSGEYEYEHEIQYDYILRLFT